MHRVAVMRVQDVTQIARADVQRGLPELAGHVPRVVNRHYWIRFAVDKQDGTSGCPSASPAPISGRSR